MDLLASLLRSSIERCCVLFAVGGGLLHQSPLSLTHHQYRQYERVRILAKDNAADFCCWQQNFVPEGSCSSSRRLPCVPYILSWHSLKFSQVGSSIVCCFRRSAVFHHYLLCVGSRLGTQLFFILLYPFLLQPSWLCSYHTIHK